jgi:hypothetical protein
MTWKEFENKMKELYPEIPKEEWIGIMQVYTFTQHAHPSEYPKELQIEKKLKKLTDLQKKFPEKKKEENKIYRTVNPTPEELGFKNKEEQREFVLKGKKANLTERLDVIADELEKVYPRLALAIDQISDRLENRNNIR